MTTKVVGVAVACATILFPLGTAFAQVEHAQRLAMEVVVRRAQVRALLCEQQRNQTATRMVQPDTALMARLPASPPIGTGGPVQVGDCSKPWWSFGR